MITERRRKDGANYYTTKYGYDPAYRLSSEANYNASGLSKMTERSYTYDPAGNRATMRIQASGGIDKTTVYGYGGGGTGYIPCPRAA
jgi:hypothetical protein